MSDGDSEVGLTGEQRALVRCGDVVAQLVEDALNSLEFVVGGTQSVDGDEQTLVGRHLFDGGHVALLEQLTAQLVDEVHQVGGVDLGELATAVVVVGQLNSHTGLVNLVGAGFNSLLFGSLGSLLVQDVLDASLVVAEQAVVATTEVGAVHVVSGEPVLVLEDGETGFAVHDYVDAGAYEGDWHCNLLDSLVGDVQLVHFQ